MEGNYINNYIINGIVVQHTRIYSPSVYIEMQDQRNLMVADGDIVVYHDACYTLTPRDDQIWQPFSIHIC